MYDMLTKGKDMIMAGRANNNYRMMAAARTAESSQTAKSPEKGNAQPENVPKKRRRKRSNRSYYSAEAQRQIEDLNKHLTESEYVLSCQCAIDILEAKLQMINAELSKQKDRTVINQVSSRLKSAESVYKKLKRRGLTPDFETAKAQLHDLIGIRVVCPFEDELYEVARRLKAQGDISVIEEKDYIKKPEKSGYRSLHLILEIPVYFSKGFQKERVEIQLRTMAMDYWSVLEYQLFYKKRVAHHTEIAAELKQYADEIASLDAHMLQLRDKIEEI